ncbi:MAG: TlpA disulfide reductase family protein [Clostridia bacterium]
MKIIKKTIIPFAVILFLFIFAILAYLFFTKLPKSKNNYISTKKRSSYIIQYANENILSNYLQNKNTLIIFWASWCHYCVEEVDELNNFIISNPNIPVIIVSHDTEEDQLKKFLKDHNLKWFVILDTNKTIRNTIDPEKTGIPSTYVLDSSSKILNYHKGKLSCDEFKSIYELNKIEEKNNL